MSQPRLRKWRQRIIDYSARALVLGVAGTVGAVVDAGLRTAGAGAWAFPCALTSGLLIMAATVIVRELLTGSMSGWQLGVMWRS